MKTFNLAVRVIASFTFISYLSSAILEEYIWRPDLKLKQSNVLMQLDGVSKVQCAVSCTLDAQCRSVSWFPSPQQCLLSNTDLLLDNAWFAKKGLEPMSGWLTFGLDVFHIVRLRPSPASRYTLSLAQAHQICRDNNFTLASRPQLLQARSIGFEECQCAWLSNGKNGFVMQQDLGRICFWYFTTDIIICNKPRADAWCFVP